MTVAQPVQTPPRRRPGRAVAVLLLLLATACTDSPPPPAGPAEALAPPTYDYLTKLRLNVASISIDDSWVPKGDGQQVANLAPTPPLDALRQMAQDRLVAAGSSGRAIFVIDDASIVHNGAGYHGALAVHLDVTTSDGTRSGFAEAHVTRDSSGVADTPDALRIALAEMTRLMMNDMNVEFEYQVRHSLRDYLLQGIEPAGGAGAVERQDLTPPPGVKASPTPAPAPAPATTQAAPAPLAPAPGAPAPTSIDPPPPPSDSAPVPPPATGDTPTPLSL